MPEIDKKLVEELKIKNDVKQFRVNFNIQKTPRQMFIGGWEKKQGEFFEAGEVIVMCSYNDGWLSNHRTMSVQAPESGIVSKILCTASEYDAVSPNSALFEYIPWYRYEMLQKQRDKEGEISREVAEQQVRAAEAERQNKLESYPIIYHVEILIKRLDEAEELDVKAGRENKYLDLYVKLKTVLQKTGNVPLERREQIMEDVMRLNQIETLFDIYSEKIKRVREDDTLDDEEREEKITSWKALRDKQIADLQSS